MNLVDEYKKRTGKTGFYNIMPISNIPSVLKHGILSYEQAASMQHASVAMQEVQTRRDNVKIPNGMMLHQYANLYFHARNPMLYVRQREEVCVLKISMQVLNLPNVVIADKNASSGYARFFEPTEAIDKLDFDLIYAEYWNDDDYFEKRRKRSIKCAEILVPYVIEPRFIIAAAVKDEINKKKLLNMGFEKQIYIDTHLFFG